MLVDLSASECPSRAQPNRHPSSSGALRRPKISNPKYATSFVSSLLGRPFILAFPSVMNAQKLLLILLYAYPLSLWTILLVSSLVRRRHQWTQSESEGTRRRSWRVIWILQATLALCFVVSAALSIPPYISAISERGNVRVAESYVVGFFSSSLRVKLPTAFIR